MNFFIRFSAISCFLFAFSLGAMNAGKPNCDKEKEVKMTGYESPGHVTNNDLTGLGHTSHTHLTESELAAIANDSDSDSDSDSYSDDNLPGIESKYYCK